MSSDVKKKIESYSKDVYVCVHCGTPKQRLIISYAESATLLKTCENEHCKELVDKYIEYDFTPLFIDVLLVKITAYRHILFNTTGNAFLPRLVLITVLLSSYVEWVFEKQLTDQTSLPVFYELELGYCTTVLSQVARVTVFNVVFLTCGFLVSQPEIGTRFLLRQTLEGVAMSYCWNLVVLPSLVWNHYAWYRVLAKLAMLVSYNLTFFACIRPSCYYSIPIVSLTCGVQWCIDQLTNFS